LKWFREALCFLTHPIKPSPPRAVANRGKAAGRGTTLRRCPYQPGNRHGARTSDAFNGSTFAGIFLSKRCNISSGTLLGDNRPVCLPHEPATHDPNGTTIEVTRLLIDEPAARLFGAKASLGGYRTIIVIGIQITLIA
jgi:hypothetical protein